MPDSESHVSQYPAEFTARDLDCRLDVCFDLHPREPCFALFFDIGTALVLTANPQRVNKDTSDPEFIRVGLIDNTPTRKEELGPQEWSTFLQAEDLEAKIKTAILC